MPGYCARLEAPLFSGQFGFSDAASRVEEQFERALNEYTMLRRETLIVDILELWDESSLYHDAGIRRTANAAISFALQVPRSLPDPEVSLDPDGEVSFDWSGHAGERFSVSINGASRLAFAGRFSETSKLHGVEQLSKAFPPEIIRGIQRTTNRYRPGAFLPAADKAQISMMGIDGLPEIEIWPLGDLVGGGRGRPATARADISADSIACCGLFIVPDPKPHPRHVNISGWPVPKEERKLIALDLCAKSELKKR